MEALKANPEAIDVIFQKHYIIPDYQRPYSWEEEQCEQLWSDIYDAYQEYKNNKNNSSYYFLGNIVIYPDETLGDQHLNVVDGQQRLTSLLLLIRALFEKNRSFNKLQNLLFASSPTDFSDIDYKTQKIKTLVIDTDNESFANIINLDKKPDKTPSKNKYINNFYVFANKIDEYLKDADADEFKDFITYIITKVKLLSIQCNNFDSALNIFSTLNNRGLPLTDNDIFKATLYKKALDTNEFLTNWQELIEFENKEFNSPSMFNNYMYYIRAENNTTTSLISLRRFFTKNHSEYLNDYEKTINYLNKFKQAHEFLQKSDGKNRNLIECLKNYPNDKPFEPIYIFLIKHLEIENNKPLLSSFNQDKFSLLLKQMVRYSYIQGLVYNSINRIKNDIYKINKDVFHNNDYIHTIKNSIKAEEIEQSIAEIKKSNLRKYNRGIVFLNSTLHHAQKSSFANYEIEIEHILPKTSYNNQDGFTTDEYSENIDRLGNLVTLEKHLNIQAKNKPFNDKKEFYKKSELAECISLLNIANWNKKAIDNREAKIIETLSKFFND